MRTLLDGTVTPLGGESGEPDRPSVELLVLDQRVLGDLADATSLPSDAFIVGAGDNAATAIAELLSSHSEVAALHVVAHGNGGGFYLGNAFWDAARIQSQQGAFGRWSAGLHADADLLLYGCDLGGGIAGQGIAAELARVTGADVAVSDDLTGPVSSGGDWELEYVVGAVEADSAYVADTLDDQLRQPLFSIGGAIGGAVTTTVAPVFDTYEAATGDESARDNFNSYVAQGAGYIDAAIGVISDPFTRELMSANKSKYIADPTWQEILPTYDIAGSPEPVYYVNGIATPRTNDDGGNSAVLEAQVLADHLGRPVRLIYNGTSSTTGDLSESLRDKLWIPPAWQHNATTREVAGLLYHSARAGKQINIVGHSQGAFIVNNAVKTANAFGYRDWTLDKLAVVLTGASMSVDGPVGTARFQRIDNPGDFLAETLGARSTSAIGKVGGARWGTSHYFRQHSFAVNYAGKISNDMFFGDGSPAFNDRFEDNDEPHTAFKLGTASVYTHLRNYFQQAAIVHEAGEFGSEIDFDYFEFRVDNAVTGSGDFFAVEFDETLIDLALHVTNVGEGFLRDATSLWGPGTLHLDLSNLGPGLYRIAIQQRNAFGGELVNANYAFHYEIAPDSFPPDRFEPNDTHSKATNLGRYAIADTPLTAFQSNLSIHNAADEDWYAIDTQDWAAKDSYVEIAFDGNFGDLDLSLHAVRNGRMMRIDDSTGTGSTERLNFNYLPADRYYVRVYGYGGDINEYSLKLNFPGAGLPPDSDEPNDTMGTAAYFEYSFSDTTLEYVDTAAGPKIVVNRVTDTNAKTDRTIHSTSDVDWYTLDLLAYGRSGDYVAISRFLNRQGDLDLELYDENGNLLRHSRTTNDFEAIRLEGLAPGDYFIKVYGYDRALNWYNLSTSFVGIKEDAVDGIGSGDSLEDAYFEEFIGRGETASDRNEHYTIHNSSDEDWYRFTVAGSTTDDSYIAVDFEPGIYTDQAYGNDSGDLDAVLYDENGNVLQIGNGTGGTELFDFGGLAAGTYYVKVFGFAGATNWYGLRYDITTKRPAEFQGIQGDRQSYVENANPLLIDSGNNAVFFDPGNSTGYDGAELRVSIVGSEYRDRIGVSSTGNGAGGINIIDNRVEYEGRTIATANLQNVYMTFDFNSAASANAITALIRRVTFLHDSDAPEETPRSVEFRFRENAEAGGGYSDVVAATVDVVAVADAPVIDNLDGDTVMYTEMQPPQDLDTGRFAKVYDPDEPDSLDGTTLTYQFVGNSTLSDRLTIRNAGSISTSGNQVRYDDETIGTFSGGVNGFTPLVITLNENADNLAASVLAWNIGFFNVSDNPSMATRQIEVTLTDAVTGIDSAPATVMIEVVAVNDRPELTNLDGDVVTYVENAAPILLDSGAAAVASDPDAPAIFDGGELVAKVIRNGQDEDRLLVLHEGTGAGEIGVGPIDETGTAEITFGGQVIGFATESGGFYDEVRVGLNGNATPSAVTALTRRIAFESSSDSPKSSIDVGVTLDDGLGAKSERAVVTVNITPVDDALVVGDLDGDSIVYTENASARRLDSGDFATVVDPDRADSIGGGQLVARITQNATANDRLTLRNSTFFDIVGDEIRDDGVLVARMSGGVGTDPLVLTFEQAADVQTAYLLTWNLAFENVSESPSELPRQVEIAISDKQNGPISTPAFINVEVVSVNDRPVLANAQTYQFDAINEDDLENPGTRVTDLLASVSGTAITDADNDPNLGIAITRAWDFDGQWQFSLDDGTTWSDLRGVTLRTARLLPAIDEARIRFLPKPNFHGLVDNHFSFYAWDGTGDWLPGDVIDVFSGGTDRPISSESAIATLMVNSVADAPLVENLDGDEVRFEVGAGPVRLDSGRSPWADNPDNTNGFNGGQLVAEIVGGADPADTLQLETSFFLELDSQTGIVSYTDDPIGTLSGGIGGTPLTIDLLPEASDRAVATLLRYLRFSNPDGEPMLGERTVEVRLSGSAGGPSTVSTVTVEVATRNDLPIVYGLNDDTPAFNEGDPPALFDVNQNLQFLNPASVVLDGGRLIARLGIGSADTGDQLQLLAGDGVTLGPDSTVLVDDIVVGTYVFASYPSMRDLTVTLNASADDSIAERILRRMAFSNDRDDLSATVRNIDVFFVDAEGNEGSRKTVSVFANIEDDVPTIVDLDGDMSTLRPADSAVVVDTGRLAQIVDPDGLATDGAVIIMTITAGEMTGDELVIVENSLLTVSGQDVLYNSATIGQIAGGSNGTPLTITFNAVASSFSLNHVVKALGFTNSEPTRPTGERTLQVEFTDGLSVAAEPVEASVNVVDNVPYFEDLDGEVVTYTEQQSSQHLALFADFIDPDSSPNFEDATLVAQFISDSDPADELLLRDGSLIGIDGNSIIGKQSANDGQVVGVWTGGTNGDPLAITFNDLADKSTVSRTVHSIAFQNPSDAPFDGDRTVRVQFTETASKPSPPADVTIQFTAVNDRPVLDTSLDYRMTTIDEDDVDNPGTLVRDLLATGGGVTDVDNSEFGIAIFNVSQFAPGTWEFSLDDGETWQIMPNPPFPQQLVLAADDATRVRFVPNSNYHGEISAGESFDFYAWDRSVGQNGQLESIGTSSHSQSYAEIKLTVAPVNDAPVLTELDGDSATFTEGQASAGLNEGTLPTVSDVDNPLNIEGWSLSARIADGATSSDQIFVGTFRFTVSGNELLDFNDTVIGTVFGGVGNEALQIVFNDQATISDLNDLIRFDLEFKNTSENPTPGLRTIEITLAESVAEGGLVRAETTMDVVPVNDEPELVSNAVLMADPIQEDATPGNGTLLRDILQRNDVISDIDSPVPYGIAARFIFENQGTWQYSTTPDTWSDLIVDSDNTLLLAADDDTRLRFLPNEDFSGVTNLSDIGFHAWDGAFGTAGMTYTGLELAVADTISDSLADIRVEVLPVNDPPVLDGFDGNEVLFTEGGSPVRLATGAVFIDDIDTPYDEFGGATVEVTIVNGGSSADRLMPVNFGLLTVSGNAILRSGEQIATFSGGEGPASPLLITMSPGTTDFNLESVFSAIAFDNDSQAIFSSPRTIRIIASDGPPGQGGVFSAPSFVTVNVDAVNDAPTDIQLDTPFVEEAVAGATVSRISVTDPDQATGHTLSVDDARFEIVDGVLKLKDGMSVTDEPSTIELEITAVDSGTPAEQFSKTLTIEVLSATPDAPNLQVPQQNFGTDDPQFFWNDLVRTMSYELQITADDPNSRVVATQSGITLTEFQYSGGLAGGTYYASVRGVGITGTEGDWSTPVEFQVEDAPPARIGNWVWDDANQNGLQDASERGLRVPGGVTVNLYSVGSDGQQGGGDDQLAATQQTNKWGRYEFEDVDPGDYFVEFVLPEGFRFSPFRTGNWKLDSNADVATGRTETFTAESGKTDHSRDAGVLSPGRIGDRVWFDEDGDGEFDTSERGARIPGGMVINLYEAGADQQVGGGDDTFVGTTRTNKWGQYNFEPLAPGRYFVEFVLPDGYAFTQQNPAVNWKKDSDADAETGLTTVFNLSANKTDRSRDAGLLIAPPLQTVRVPVFPPEDQTAPVVAIEGNPFSRILPLPLKEPSELTADESSIEHREEEEDDESVIRALDALLMFDTALLQEL